MNKRAIKNLILKFLNPSQIKVAGRGAGVDKDLSVCLKNCTIIVKGKGSRVVFGKNCMLSGVHIYVNGENCRLVFGENVHVNASVFQPTHINAFGNDRTIIIGDNCLIYNNVEIHTTDYHKIYDRNGNRINEDKDVTIGNNVWIGLGATILKGSVIPDGTILGAKTLVAGTIEEKNCIAVGSPSKIIRTNCYWSEL